MSGGRLEKRSAAIEREDRSQIVVGHLSGMGTNIERASVFVPTTADFLKEYLPDSSMEMMKIPSSFVNAVGGDVSSCYTLEVDSGDCWDVDTKFIHGRWYLAKDCKSGRYRFICKIEQGYKSHLILLEPSQFSASPISVGAKARKRN